MSWVLPTIHHKLSWLWFLPALFADSNVNYPLIVWSQRRKAGKPFELKIDLGLIAGQILAIFLWSLPQRSVVDNLFEKNLGPMLLVLGFAYMVHFAAQLIFKFENLRKYGFLIKLIGPLASYGLNYWRDGHRDETIYGLYAMINYDLLFMSQGIVDTIYSEELQCSFDYFSKTSVMPFMFVLWGINASVFSPLAYHDENFLFFYPLYNPTWMQSLYTSGSFY